MLLRVFRIDPRLDGMAVQFDLVLRQRQFLAERHPQLPFHQIFAGDRSVTGCSTCSRVFISMNQMRSADKPPEASAMNSMVPAPT